MIDILYCSFNRKAFTEASFPALTRNTDWDQVHALYIADDASRDGTAEWLFETADAGVDEIPGNVYIYENRGPFGGPVAAMNWYLDECDMDAVDKFAKIDSDFVVCPDWLPEMLGVMHRDPGIDVLGVQPRFGPAVWPGECERGSEAARHVGGIGIMRHRMFDVCHPVAKGRFGWTEFQTIHPESRKAWITPDLPCFSLDLIDLEPWRSLTTEYVNRGWARRWPEYEGGGRGYYEWWIQALAAVEAE